MKDFETSHKLFFYAAPWEYDGDWKRFKVGTCHGLWRSTKDAYEILAVDNDNPGNGHFTDVLEWFEHSAKRDKKVLRVVELWNENLCQHLINKRGFTLVDPMNVVKRFDVKSRLKQRLKVTAQQEATDSTRNSENL